MTLLLERDPWGKLVYIDASGKAHGNVTPVRMFPISDPASWIALCDARGHELAMVESLADVEPTTRLLLEEELGQRGFIPVIQRVYRISSLSEPCEWDVETDRGRASFVLRSEDDVHRMSPHQAIIVDARGLRFLIRDAREFDATSRRFVEWYL